MGSDTEPPCNEDVHWVLMKDRLLIDELDFNELQKAVTGGGQNNARKVMPFGDRKVYSHDECSHFIYPEIPTAEIPDA